MRLRQSSFFESIQHNLCFSVRFLVAFFHFNLPLSAGTLFCSHEKKARMMARVWEIGCFKDES